MLRAVADGLAACLLDRSDGNKTMLRAISREMLAAAVLRNIMFYFTPYTVNKARAAGDAEFCSPGCVRKRGCRSKLHSTVLLPVVHP